MNRIVFDAAEKRALWGALPAWELSALRRPLLEATAAQYGVDAKDAYATLLHLDTLAALGPEAPLVWKGGTAVQSYLPPETQRISVDLDFNSTTPSPEILREAFLEANDRLEGAGAIVTAQGIGFGAFYEADHRPAYRTIEFRRVLPTPFDERIDLKAGSLHAQPEDVRVQGRLSRVQVNYGHHALPALESAPVKVGFFTQPRHEPRRPVIARRASSSDLVADKILATTRHDGFGRERFKDLYDLIALRHHGAPDPRRVTDKLGRIVGSDNVQRIVEGTLETLRILGEEVANAQGFKASACSAGKRWVEGWQDENDATADWLLEMTTP